MKGNSKKKFFHEIPQKEVDKLIKDKKTIQYLMDNYSQPKWCNYHNALEAEMGCWSLMDLRKDGIRTKISKKYCKDCDEFKKPIQ